MEGRRRLKWRRRARIRRGSCEWFGSATGIEDGGGGGGGVEKGVKARWRKRKGENEKSSEKPVLSEAKTPLRNFHFFISKITNNGNYLINSRGRQDWLTCKDHGERESCGSHARYKQYLLIDFRSNVSLRVTSTSLL